MSEIFQTVHIDSYGLILLMILFMGRRLVKKTRSKQKIGSMY